MRSAVYFPKSTLTSNAMMRSSLLLWDQVHTIVPWPNFPTDYGDQRDMAEAWDLIGRQIVPDDHEKKIAHDNIEELLNAGIPKQMLLLNGALPEEPYEVWPQKLARETWELLQMHQVTPGILPNGDYPFTDEGGMLVMAKLADAVAGTTFARVTDRLMAYGMTATVDDEPPEVKTVTMTLDLIDETQIPFESLLEFRRREAAEAKGEGLRLLRYSYADKVQEHVDRIKTLRTDRERGQANDEFRDAMKADLTRLGREITGHRTELALKSAVVTTVVGVGTALGASFVGPAAFIAAGGVALGVGLTEAAKNLAGVLDAGFGYKRKQREAMAKHPMAYMYQLSRA